MRLRPPPSQQDGRADGRSRAPWSSLSYLRTPTQAGEQGLRWELRGQMRSVLGPCQAGDFL